jgi:hypothetical protein
MTHPISLWRRSAVARPAALAVSTARANPSTAGSRSEGSAAAVAGGVGSKPFGTGGELRQSGLVRAGKRRDHGLVIEAKAEKARLPRWS